jgi:soluble lytic murein transglycosylase
VRYQARGCITYFLLFSALIAALLAPVSVQSQDLSRQRMDYVDALQAMNRGDWKAYEQLRSGLSDYPLAIYLDYFKLTRQPIPITTAEAQRFLSDSVDTPLRNRFLAFYLRKVGKAHRWQDFLSVNPNEPGSVKLQCYYFRAQLARGETALAWEGARKLWEHGQSQPRECDPLFNAWQAAGQLTDAVVWARLVNAFDARQGTLLRYVVKKSSADLRPWADRLMAVYSNPASLVRQSLPQGNPYSADIVSYGIAYLARYNPPKALSYWSDYQKRMQFSPEQTYKVEYAIARQSLFARTDSHNQWLEGALVRLADDKLVGIRLRWALSEQDWRALARNLPLLSEPGRDKTVWRYWQAMVLERRGDADGAKSLLEQLAKERDYYGFLAADKIGRPYAFNHLKLQMNEEFPVKELPAFSRIEELKFHNEPVHAHSEWYKVLQDNAEPAQLQNLMLLASQNGWDRMAIDAASRAKAWDALDQRFPTSYGDVFKRHASARGVPATEVMAIARRESAFFPKAISPAGARGLMQIMPATGKSMAASLKQPHSREKLYEVEHNVLLGSAYYRQLLDRFDGNRVFALTGYNAGPNRVSRWRHKAGQGSPVEVWIETIPYQETRNYVQAVLSYNVVFQYLLGDTQRLFTPAERKASY